jgi:hypothetical protein
LGCEGEERERVLRWLAEVKKKRKSSVRRRNYSDCALSGSDYFERKFSFLAIITHILWGKSRN